MERQEVYNILDSERDYQDKKWNDPDGDPNYHEPAAFILYMEHHLAKARSFISVDTDANRALHEMRKVVALGIACFEDHGVPERPIAPSLQERKENFGKNNKL